MSKTITTQIQVQTVGDGENRTDSYTIINPGGVPPTTVSLANATNVTVPIPPGAVGALIISPTNTLIAKGVNADTGAPVSNGQMLLMFFAATQASFVLMQSSGAGLALRIIWL